MTHMKQTGAAAAVLWRSLLSVLTSANQGVRSGFELRVAALLADIAAANSARRMALVGAGRGVVVDWLLEIASGNGNGDRGGTQAEAARALAHLVADPAVCEKVLGRPGAVPSLLRFIFSFQPKKPNKVAYHLIMYPCVPAGMIVRPTLTNDHSSFGFCSCLFFLLVPCCYAIFVGKSGSV